MMRVRYYNGIPKGLARSWFHMYVATYGSVEAHESRPDTLARNPRTGEAVPVPPRKVPVFKVSKELKDMVAQG